MNSRANRATAAAVAAAAPAPGDYRSGVGLRARLAGKVSRDQVHRSNAQPILIRVLGSLRSVLLLRRCSFVFDDSVRFRCQLPVAMFPQAKVAKVGIRCRGWPEVR